MKIVKRILPILLLLVLGFQLFLAVRIHQGKTHNLQEGQEAETGVILETTETLTQPMEVETFEDSAPQDQISQEEAALSENAMISKPVSVDDRKEGLPLLKEQIEESLEGLEGEWSVYVENLESKVYFSINNRRSEADDLIDLYIMGSVYQQIEEEKLEATALIDNMTGKMITTGDNSSANKLLLFLSEDEENEEEAKEAVNAFCKDAGYTMTRIGSRLWETEKEKTSGVNFTSVEDCGLFLEKIYKNINISAQISQEMLQILKKQTSHSKIPAGLPSGVGVADLPGETEDALGDAAIVYSADCDYILCIMAEDLEDMAKAKEELTDLSGQVYEYFNPSSVTPTPPQNS